MESFVNQLHAWFDNLLTPVGAYQLLVIIISIISSLVINKKWQAYVLERLGDAEKAGFKRFALRSTGLMVLPLLVLLFIAAGQGLLLQLNFKTPLLSVFIPLLLSLAVIRFIVFALRRAYSPSPALKAMEGFIATTIWLAVALHLLGWLPDIIAALDKYSIQLGEIRLSVLSIASFLLTVAFFIVAAQWLSNWIERRTQKSEVLSGTMRVAVAKFSRVFLYTVAVIVAMNSVGIDLTTLAVFSGALGVGLGFGLQRITSNFISGFILLFDRSIKPGDVISINNRIGWVQELRARYIVVRDRDGVETLIPNENLITSEVTNWSYTDRNVRVKIPVQISYDDDPEQAMEVMVKASEISDRVLQDPPPQARLMSFGDNGIDLELRIWIIDPETGVGNVRSDVNLAIWKGFKAAGITIPFPQRDVRLIKNDNPVAEPL